MATELGTPDPVERAAAARFNDDIVKLRRDVAAEVLAAWDVADGVENFAQFSGQVVRSIEPTYQAATLAALEMVFGILAAQGQGVSPSVVLMTPTDRLVRVMQNTSVDLARQLIENGATPEDAAESARKRTSLTVQQIMTDTANYQAEQASGANRAVLQAHGRHCEPGACAFCLRLAGGARYRAVYNVTEKWYRPHPNCHCTLIPLGRYRLVRVRSASEIAAGRVIHKQIKDAKDRQMARSGQSSGRVSVTPDGLYTGAERITLPEGFKPVRIA